MLNTPYAKFLISVFICVRLNWIILIDSLSNPSTTQWVYFAVDGVNETKEVLSFFNPPCLETKG